MLLQVQRNGRILGTRFLTEGLQSRLHVTNLCERTMLFGIVWVLLSQAFAAWRG